MVRRIFVSNWDRPNINTTDFNAHQDGEFEAVNIGVNMLTLVKMYLIKCPTTNVDLFVISPDETSIVDPSLACNYLNIDPSFKHMAKRKM